MLRGASVGLGSHGMRTETNEDHVTVPALR
jgi:hypothetical protein